MPETKASEPSGEDFKTNERKTGCQGRTSGPKNEALGAPLQVSIYWERIPSVESTQEFLGTSKKIYGAGCETWADTYFGFVKKLKYEQANLLLKILEPCRVRLAACGGR